MTQTPAWYPFAAAGIATLVAVLILPKMYRSLVNHAEAAFGKTAVVEERKAGWEPLLLGVGFIAVGALVTWLAYKIEIDWLGGGSHVVSVGAFIYGAYETLRGLGILLLRRAAAGVLVGAGLFVGFCIYMAFYSR
jgi:hypothetical protein